MRERMTRIGRLSDEHYNKPLVEIREESQSENISSQRHGREKKKNPARNMPLRSVSVMYNAGGRGRRTAHAGDAAILLPFFSSFFLYKQTPLTVGMSLESMRKRRPS
jgi:hypothetical protein